MWHRIAPVLSKRFTVLALDLRGYGWSSAPASRNGEAYAKRLMGRDVVTVMEAFGAASFALVGHDRGARVGYRLALDQPGRISKLALLDIYPTMEVWRAIEAGTDAFAALAPIWPNPRPDRKPGSACTPTSILRVSCVNGPKVTRPTASIRALWPITAPPGMIPLISTPSARDYRAGATLDRAADEADEAAGKTHWLPDENRRRYGLLGLRHG